MPVKIIAEAGQNHNGSVDLAQQLVDIAANSGCQYVKFQKRTPALCVPEHQRDELRVTPWGVIRYLDYRERLEFGEKEYTEIDKYCEARGIEWFASVWDLPSAEFLRDMCRRIVKIPSARLTDPDLIRWCRTHFEIVILSTGMSTEEEIEKAVATGDPDVILHCCAAYPAKTSDLNLRYIAHLKEKYPEKAIGYSSHSLSFAPILAATALGSEWLECHITLDKAMYGSDQIASLGPIELLTLVRSVRDVEAAMGVGGERVVLESELEKRKSLRG